MVIRETKVFTRQVQALLSDEDYAKLQWNLAVNPAAGDRIPGGHGIRKLRVRVAGRGKRGGARLIYYWAVRREVILMLAVYAKSAQADLSPAQTAALGQLAQEEFGDE